MSEHQSHTSQESTHQLMGAEGGEQESGLGISMSPPSLQLTASADQGGQSGPIQKTEEARERSQGGNPINVAVPLIKANYGSIGSTLLTTHHVAGIVYAESQLNTDLLDAIGDLIGASSSVGPGQLTQAAITEVDNRVGAAAFTAFESQFGARPTGWRAIAEHEDWAYFYTAGYLAYSITRAADLFQSVDGAESHIPLGMAFYQGAFATMRDLRRRIADEKGIPRTDVTWNMIVEASRTPRGMKGGERQSFEYATMAEGGFDFGFTLSREMEGRSFHIPERRVKMQSDASYTGSGPAGRTYSVELKSLYIPPPSPFGGGSFPQIRSHGKADYPVGRSHENEWTGLIGGGDVSYYFIIKNETGSEISGEGYTNYLY